MRRFLPRAYLRTHIAKYCCLSAETLAARHLHRQQAVPWQQDELFIAGPNICRRYTTNGSIHVTSAFRRCNDRLSMNKQYAVSRTQRIRRKRNLLRNRHTAVSTVTSSTENHTANKSKLSLYAVAVNRQCHCQKRFASDIRGTVTEHGAHAIGYAHRVYLGRKHGRHGDVMCSVVISAREKTAIRKCQT